MIRASLPASYGTKNHRYKIQKRRTRYFQLNICNRKKAKGIERLPIELPDTPNPDWIKLYNALNTALNEKTIKPNDARLTPIFLARQFGLPEKVARDALEHLTKHGFNVGGQSIAPVGEEEVFEVQEIEKASTTDQPSGLKPLLETMVPSIKVKTHEKNPSDLQEVIDLFYLAIEYWKEIAKIQPPPNDQEIWQCLKSLALKKGIELP